jgi:hypothetical protein
MYKMKPSSSSPLDSFMLNLLNGKTSGDADDDEPLVISSDHARMFTFQARKIRIQWSTKPSRSSKLLCMRQSDLEADLEESTCPKQSVLFDTTISDRFSRDRESHQPHRVSRWNPTTHNRKLSDPMPLRIPHRTPLTESIE